MSSTSPIERFQPGTPLTAARLNQSLDRGLMEVRVASGSGLTVRKVGNAFVIGLVPQRAPGGSAPSLAILQVTGNATPGGLYTAKVFIGDATLNPTLGLIAGSLSGDTVYLKNEEETVSHVLPTGFRVIAVSAGSATDGKLVYMCRSYGTPTATHQQPSATTGSGSSFTINWDHVRSHA